MDHFARLQLIGRVSYYLGWIGLLCGALVHLNVARGLFPALDLTQRNLFEVSVVCFLICIASEQSLPRMKRRIHAASLCLYGFVYEAFIRCT